MIGQFVKGKTAVFIDAENLFYTQRTLGWRVSYERLIAYIKRECGKETKILMSGDSDFSAPIHYIKEQGKRIIVLSTRGHISRELLELAKYVDLKKLRDEIAQDRPENSKTANRRS